MRTQRVALVLRTSGAAHTAAVAAVIAGVSALLLWDVFHYDWLRGYDAYANSLYADALRDHHRLPTTAETDVWHTPPLFFAVAAAVGSHRAVQIIGVVAALAVVVFAWLMARTLFPGSRSAQLGALAFAGLTPVLVRASVMYHPEALATALATAGVFTVVRALANRRVTYVTGVVAGVLFGLATLTRTWALAPAAACCLALLVGTRRNLLAGGAFAAVIVALTTPWFVHQWVEHGSPIAFNRPAPQESFFSRRPASFYTSIDADGVFSHPYAPNFLNHLLPVTYSDWWGDYWRYFEVPAENISTPPQLPETYEAPRVRQNYVGIAPSLLAFAGMIGLAFAGLRGRRAEVWVVPLAIVLLAVQFLLFQIAYPHSDGDTIKASYLLNAAAPLAVCFGYALSLVFRAGRLVGAAFVLLLAYAMLLDVSFLTLPA